MRAKNASKVGPRYPAGRRPGGRHGRPVATQAAAGPVPSLQCRLHPRLPHHRRLAGRHRRSKASARSPAKRSISSPAARSMRPTGPPSQRPWTTCRCRPGAGALKAAVETAELSLAGESRRVHYLSVPPSAALPAVRLLAEAGLVERCRIIMEKPFGTDLASAVVAERQAARGLRRGADLPHRPLPRQGAGAEHPGLPLRQRPVRADLEPQLHRPRADRRARDAGPRQARPASTRRPARFATWW